MLDQIKLEKSEEANLKIKKQILEQQKLKRDLEQRLQKEINENNQQQQRQTRIFQNISNKKQPNAIRKKQNQDPPTKKEAIITPRLIFDPQRPAFASSQIKSSYCEYIYLV